MLEIKGVVHEKRRFKYKQGHSNFNFIPIEIVDLNVTTPNRLAFQGG